MEQTLVENYIKKNMPTKSYLSGVSAAIDERKTVGQILDCLQGPSGLFYLNTV